MKKTRLSILALAIAITLPGITASSPENFDEDPYLILCGEADSAIARQDYHSAAARLNDAMAVKPHSPSNVLLLANLGMVYSMMDSDSLALSSLQRAIDEYPGMKIVHTNRAHVLLKLNRDHEAYEEFSTVLKLDSLDTEARYYHGIIALYSGWQDIAERDFKILDKLEPRTERTALALATLYSLTGRSRDAIPHYQTLINSDPAAEYYAALAGCYLQIQNLSEAAYTIAEGLKKYPEDPELFYYRAWLNRDRYRTDDAHADAKRAVALGANPARVKALFETPKKPSGKFQQ